MYTRKKLVNLAFAWKANWSESIESSIPKSYKLLVINQIAELNHRHKISWKFLLFQINLGQKSVEQVPEINYFPNRNDLLSFKKEQSQYQTVKNRVTPKRLWSWNEQKKNKNWPIFLLLVAQILYSEKMVFRNQAFSIDPLGT